ncbi:hypothetical protein EVAR_67029_1 [Eumeta japonica]|uniref:Uncharacterized protein n=1 Tax=Eumeta variegata TaxID=151549 RepID=A0A4C1ZTN5_EUMVA|nr:hypothetical protein EVAR_67029_1 [Eumeta japonica]
MQCADVTHREGTPGSGSPASSGAPRIIIPAFHRFSAIFHLEPGPRGAPGGHNSRRGRDGIEKESIRQRNRQQPIARNVPWRQKDGACVVIGRLLLPCETRTMWNQNGPGEQDHVESEWSWGTGSCGIRMELGNRDMWNQNVAGKQDHVESEWT